MHIHRLISSDGVSEVTISEQDFDRRWLQRQRLTDGPVVVAYGGYTSISRATASIDTSGITYLGYVFEDTSACSACQGSQ